MRFILIIIITNFIYASNARIMTYNILNYQDDNNREDDYIEIIDFVDPDILMIQEIISQTGFTNFKSDVLDVVEPGAWTGATFTNQSAQQDIALFYKHDDFSFLSTTTINTASSSGLRDVVEFVMIHDPSGIEFNIYGVHFKASSGASNASQRLNEATVLRNYLNGLSEGTPFLVVGDFNIYSNSSNDEPAFDMLTGSSGNNNGRLFDPINRIGPWHNNSSYSDVHTQSPRTQSFGGGANGGMDDRFDWLFVCESILNQESDMHYIEESYWAVGNDGNHFNDAINDGNNASVSDAIADALHNASDHLPVYMDIWFDDLFYNDLGIVISEIMPNPSSVSDSYGEWFEIHNTTDSIINIHGWAIRDTDNDYHTIENESSSILINPGQFFVMAINSDMNLNGGLQSHYEYNNLYFSNSEDAIILLDTSGAIIDEVHYTGGWPFQSGASMELHDFSLDNNESDNWSEANLYYGDGDLGSPGTNYDGTSVYNIDDSQIPSAILLSHPYPNPFNPLTTIDIVINVKQYCIINMVNINGKIVDVIYQGEILPGNHQFKWNANDQSSGIYFINLIGNGRAIQTEKVVLVK